VKRGAAEVLKNVKGGLRKSGQLVKKNPPFLKRAFDAKRVFKKSISELEGHFPSNRLSQFIF